jgi:hypothetical protein
MLVILLLSRLDPGTVIICWFDVLSSFIIIVSVGDICTLDKFVADIQESFPLEEEVATILKNYLSCHSIGEEDPLLLVSYLPQLQMVSFSICI